MNCEHCGNIMCAETVIKLRRTWLGVRHSRHRGAYCAGCRVSVVLGETDAPSRQESGTVCRIDSGWWRSFIPQIQANKVNCNGQPAYERKIYATDWVSAR